jgi:hypothetical protein
MYLTVRSDSLARSPFLLCLKQHFLPRPVPRRPSMAVFAALTGMQSTRVYEAFALVVVETLARCKLLEMRSSYLDIQ